MDERRRRRRLGEAGAVVAAAAHLLAPELLLRTARWGYDTALAVDFEPRPAATRRVRLVGLALLVAGLASAWLRRR